MFEDLLMELKTLPWGVQVYVWALLFFAMLGILGHVLDHPEGLRGALQEGVLWAVAIFTVNLVVGISLAIVFLPVLLFTTVFGWPYILSACLGLPIGIFVAAIILLWSGIAER